MNRLNKNPVFSEKSEVWQQFKKGNFLALQALMEQYGRFLFSYGSKYSDDADFIKDCIQDLFLEMWQKRAELNDNVVIKAYLLACLRRQIQRAIDIRRMKPGHLTTNADHFSVEFSVNPNLVEDETARQVVGNVQRLIEQLPKRQQEVVYLKFFQELDRDHIAVVMRTAPQSVSNLLQEAIRYFRCQWKAGFSLISLLSMVF
ncbi:sigma-70 family RNA polymerase sigma factor [Larkinella knui]|uniref:Sigma-70 family RNA polymerase sigma factor n=1 Tax=Larkinella knui TaxID=2025310 RepID=A0A3P1CK04_9BACT|nr:sigma-70 family RNA polymerase sigma factor [Larkinella knui]RRB13673.1 sigma-70 family RNA polymerase sigma factor [Larkinella knui]